MDDVDVTAERDVAEAPLRLAASRKPVGPQPNGWCHWCGELIPDDDRWCKDSECMSLWVRERRLKYGIV